LISLKNNIILGIKGGAMQIKVSLLKAIFFERNIKQWQFCQQIGLSENYLSRILHKKVEPATKLVARIAQTLKIDPRLLAEDNQTLPPNHPGPKQNRRTRGRKKKVEASSSRNKK
jgi:transcriptional regulator with XRE-family HTH domain